MRRVLVDTGPIVAILSGRDQYHRVCVEALKEMPGPLFTCWPVLTEAAWLLRRDWKAVEKLLNSIGAGFVEMLPLTSADSKAIAAIMNCQSSITGISALEKRRKSSANPAALDVAER